MQLPLVEADLGSRGPPRRKEGLEADGAPGYLHRLSHCSPGSGSRDLGLASCAFAICALMPARRALLWGAHLDAKLTAHPAQAGHLTSNCSQIHQASSNFVLFCFLAHLLSQLQTGKGRGDRSPHFLTTLRELDRPSHSYLILSYTNPPLQVWKLRL